MAEHSTPRRVCLEGHASTVLPEGVGTLVTCISGCVWLTCYGDPRDLILHAGDSFRIDGPGTVVMTAHHGAVLQIFPGEAPPPCAAQPRRQAGRADCTALAQCRAAPGRRFHARVLD